MKRAKQMLMGIAFVLLVATTFQVFYLGEMLVKVQDQNRIMMAKDVQRDFNQKALYEKLGVPNN